MKFEQAVSRLEEIARILESGEIPLDESMKLFEEGMELIALCNQKLDEAEKKIQLLSRNADGSLETRPWEGEPE
ncbi:MAG: exodeoxyribonuclease VII small subunit [Calditrichaeota bacterium]|nr:MAG: exodeoxyribonuclease VII small subunit [Calditrichota bacterium]